MQHYFSIELYFNDKIKENQCQLLSKHDVLQVKLWTPWKPISNGNPKEIDNPKESNRKTGLLYGRVHYMKFLFPIKFLFGLIQKLKSFIFMRQMITKYIVKRHGPNQQEKVKYLIFEMGIYTLVFLFFSFLFFIFIITIIIIQYLTYKRHIVDMVGLYFHDSHCFIPKKPNQDIHNI